jgi:hypothetical protein
MEELALPSLAFPDIGRPLQAFQHLLGHGDQRTGNLVDPVQTTAGAVLRAADQVRAYFSRPPEQHFVEVVRSIMPPEMSTVVETVVATQDPAKTLGTMVDVAARRVVSELATKPLLDGPLGVFADGQLAAELVPNLGPIVALVDIGHKALNVIRRVLGRVAPALERLGLGEVIRVLDAIASALELVCKILETLLSPLKTLAHGLLSLFGL